MKNLNKKATIEKYHKVFFRNASFARELIMSLDYKGDHLLLGMIAETYFDQAAFQPDGERRKILDGRWLRLAEKYIISAFKLRMICSNVLWTLGKVRQAYGQIDLAIFCYQEIIRIGVKGICRDSCKNTLDISEAQVNDSKFELYRLYHDTNPGLSKRYLTLYKKGLEKGIYSLYTPLEKYLLP